MDLSIPNISYKWNHKTYDLLCSLRVIFSKLLYMYIGTSFFLWPNNIPSCSRILEWVAVPFFRGSSQPRNQTGVSWIAGGFITIWATREAQIIFHCVFIVHFIYSFSCRQTFGLFPYTVVDTSAVNMHIYACLCMCFPLSWYIPSCGIAGLCGNSMVNFLRNCQSIFPSGWII